MTVLDRASNVQSFSAHGLVDSRIIRRQSPSDSSAVAFIFCLYLSSMHPLPSSRLQNITVPVMGFFKIPAAYSCSANSNIIPSHPFAASMSTATGKYSVCPVIVEL